MPTNQSRPQPEWILNSFKEQYGDRITLWGGVNNENLIGGKSKDVGADARYVTNTLHQKVDLSMEQITHWRLESLLRIS